MYKQCKTCGNPIYYDYDTPSKNDIYCGGFCSIKCAKESPEGKDAIEVYEFLINAIGKEKTDNFIYYSEILNL